MAFDYVSSCTYVSEVSLKWKQTLLLRPIQTIHPAFEIQDFEDLQQWNTAKRGISKTLMEVPQDIAYKKKCAINTTLLFIFLFNSVVEKAIRGKWFPIAVEHADY